MRSGSIGIASSGPSSHPEQLLHDAEQALYVAKAAAKGRAVLRRPDSATQLAQLAYDTRLLRITAELGYALDRDELIIYGQPVVDLRSGRTVAVESLVRWAHPERGILAPSEFLDVAEATNLIVPIGRRVLWESCRIAATWVDLLGAAAPSIHVNVSGRQLETGYLHEEVLQALSAFHLEPSQLVLELTETHMPLIADSLRRDLQDLRDRGVRVAIDDLGTGYSSLTRITELPVDILKIDRSFVRGMESDPACAAVVRGVLAIGDALGLEVVAEGVETSSQAMLLADYGCARAQGYLYSQPVPEESLLNDLSHRRWIPRDMALSGRPPLMTTTPLGVDEPAYPVVTSEHIDATRSMSSSQGAPSVPPDRPRLTRRFPGWRLSVPWRGLLPTGSALPDRVWAGRHRTVLTILWLHVVLLGTIAFLSVDSVAHLLLEAAGVGMIASLAGIRGLGRDVRACLTSAGLVASSMILVHTSDGLAEMHFHFFVMILLISLYQSWKPLVLALVLIFLHHGLGETVLGVHVYDHPPGESWVWALIHGGFVLAQVIAALMFWRLVEAAQESERGAQHALSAAREAVVAAELARAGERGAAIGAELARAGYREAAIAAELTRAGDREAVIAAELTSAAEVQRALLPKLDTQLPGYEISGDCIPSKAVGGDFFDWYPVEGGLGFTLSDVMGKGAAAGIVAATARAVIRSAKEVADPVTALSRADKMLSTELGDGDFFATAFHARLNAIDGRVQYVDAGHGLSILVREDGSWERLHSDDPPLGMGLGVRRSAKEAVLERGDVLVSFSDGVLDLYDGTLRAIDHVALLATSASTADEIVTSLRQVAMRAGNPDDVTVLAIRRVD